MIISWSDRGQILVKPGSNRRRAASSPARALRARATAVKRRSTVGHSAVKWRSNGGQTAVKPLGRSAVGPCSDSSRSARGQNLAKPRSKRGQTGRPSRAQATGVHGPPGRGRPRAGFPGALRLFRLSAYCCFTFVIHLPYHHLSITGEAHGRPWTGLGPFYLSYLYICILIYQLIICLFFGGEALGRSRTAAPRVGIPSHGPARRRR